MKHLPVIVAVIVAALTFLPASKKAEGPVATAMAGASRSDRSHLKGIYLSLADVTEKDNGALITTVGMWRQLHINTLKLAAADMRGKYPGLDVAVEKVMAESFPLDDVTMSGALVAKIAAACREVAHQSE
jgi:hypothetical protein